MKGSLNIIPEKFTVDAHEDGEFEFTIFLPNNEETYKFINKKQATELRDFLNKFLEDE